MWEYLRRWLFPVACLGCDAPDVAICSGCLPAPSDALFAVAGSLGVLAAGRYGGVLQRSIVAMKRGERAYLDPFAQLLAATLRSEIGLIPVPTSPRRRAERGFDQAVELARRTAALRGLTFHDVLEKRGPAQRGLSRLARLQSAGRFRIRRGMTLPPCAVLVDDVCTTGATLSGAAAALETAGVSVRAAVVLAYTAPGRNSGPLAAVLTAEHPPEGTSNESNLERYRHR